MLESSQRALIKLRKYAESFLRPNNGADQPLLSIFSQLYGSSANDPQPPPEPRFFAPRPFALDDETLFPKTHQEAINTDSSWRDNFATLYAQLQPDSEANLEQIYYLLQHYAWAVPAPDDHRVSLFDQARTEAALAAANIDGNGVYIIGGALSGIQDFIYTLTAAGATKALRARSFYLQLLTDAIAYYLLRQIQMPITNLIYSGGGKFYIIAPAASQSQLLAWQRDLALLMLNRHSGDLFVAISGLVFTSAVLENPKAFAEHWDDLTDAIGADKKRRFAALDADELSRKVFTPFGQGGRGQNHCIVCGYQGTSSEITEFRPDEEIGLQSQGNICVLCYSFEALARDLRPATMLGLSFSTAQIPDQPLRVPALHILQDLGVHIKPLAISQDQSWPSPAVYQRVLKIQGSLSFVDQKRLIQHGLIWGHRAVMNAFPVTQSLHSQSTNPHEAQLAAWFAKHPDEEAHKVGGIKTFGLLVRQSKGIHRLGILRMDVDDLGGLFSALQAPSLARISSLSAALARFFEGWVDHLCHDFNSSKHASNTIYGVYSGGDDLFIVGTWDVMPKLARRISFDLERYAHNPRVHISAGLTLHGQKFPLYQGAKEAHEALEQAKSRAPRIKHNKASAKNAWSFLDQVVGWEEADQVFQLQARLVMWIERGVLSRAVLQVLQILYGQYMDHLMLDEQKHGFASQQSSSQLFYGPWIWHGVYQLARISKEGIRFSSQAASASEAEQWKQAAADLLQEIRTRLTNGAQQPPKTCMRFIEQIGLAARWAQLEVRSNADD